VFRPSVLGPGAGILAERSDTSAVGAALSAAMAPASDAALERFRVEAGIPLYGTDFDSGALPSEASLESAIDFTKGCFLGQESVAKVRNLGHPPTVLVALRAPNGVRAGDGVYADGAEVGTVTSAASVPDRGTTLFARVRWDAAREALSTSNGVALSVRPVNGTET
jgi:tRNA-modifying protein YgfZ